MSEDIIHRELHPAIVVTGAAPYRKPALALRPLARIWKSIRKPCLKWLEAWRRQRFLLQAMIEGGGASFPASTRFYHRVYFYGRGKLTIWENVILGYPPAGMVDAAVLLQPREKESQISIGSGTFIMNGCEIISRQSIEIGKSCLIGAGSVIYDSDFHTIDPKNRMVPGKTKPVVIGDNVWIGRAAVILKGVKIGRDAVVGACCVVTKDVAAGEIVAGNPMRSLGSVYRTDGG